MLMAIMQWSNSVTQLAALVPLVIVIVDLVRRMIHNRIERKGYPLPPGPTPFPILGSALSINTQQPWLTYTEWQAKYGECSPKPE